MDRAKSGTEPALRRPGALPRAHGVPPQLSSAKNEPKGTLYIPTKTTTPKPAPRALMAPQPKAAAPAQKAQSEAKNEKKLPPVKRLAIKFRKGGLGKFDAMFNARFIYCAWKSERVGRRPKEYMKTVSRHPLGWAKTRAPGDVYEQNAYDRYMALLTFVAKLWGLLCVLLTPAQKFLKAVAAAFSGFSNPSRAKKSLVYIAKKVFALLLPAASVMAAALVIISISSVAPQLELTLNGQSVGYVESKQTVANVVSVLERDIASVLGEPYEYTGEIGYRVVLERTQRPCVPESELYSLMYASPQAQGAVTVAYGLYIDGELIIAAESQGDIDKVLNEILQENAGDIGEDGRIGFANNIEIIENNYAKRDVVTQDELKDIITYSAAAEPVSEETEPLYEVAEATIPLYDGSGLAEYLGEQAQSAEDIAAVAAASSIELTPEAINTIPRGFLSTNENNVKDDILSRLSRTSASTTAGALQFKKTKTETYTVEVAYEVEYIESDQYYKDTQIVRTNGSNGEDLVTADVTYIGDVEVGREIRQVETLKAPTKKVVVVGTKPKPLAGPTGGFIRPVKGGYTTSRFGNGHRGVDLVVPLGSSISASDGGTVIYAGYSGSYGNHIKIRHSDGFVTLYAHLSTILVKYGDKLYQGQEIGKCGSTGNSTGPHLHFEVIKNGVQVNPELYMK